MKRPPSTLLLASLLLLTPARAEEPSKRAVVLIPGIGNPGEAWRSKNIVQQLAADPRFQDAGNIVCGEPALPNPPEDAGKTSVFTLTLPECGQVDIYESGRALALSLGQLRQERGVEKFVLVGKSLGGVVAREYLTSCLYADDVAQLITIASPHSGSELAALPALHAHLQGVAERCHFAAAAPAPRWRDHPGRWVSLANARMASTTTHWLENLSENAPWRIESPGLLMLQPPAEGNYLDRLNQRPHPANVAYTCVITAKHLGNYRWADIKGDWHKYRTDDCQHSRFWTALSDAGRAALLVCSQPSRTRQHLAGDGAVSKRSQDLNAIPAFQTNSALKAKRVEINAGHHDEQTALDLAGLIAGK